MEQELMSFHAGRWNELCVRLAAQASRQCGLAHDQYQRLFSEAVDERLKEIPELHHPAALEVAHRWDYLAAEQRDVLRSRSVGHV